MKPPSFFLNEYFFRYSSPKEFGIVLLEIFGKVNLEKKLITRKTLSS